MGNLKVILSDSFSNEWVDEVIDYAKLRKELYNPQVIWHENKNFQINCHVRIINDNITVSKCNFSLNIIYSVQKS